MRNIKIIDIEPYTDGRFRLINETNITKQSEVVNHYINDEVISLDEFLDMIEGWELKVSFPISGDGELRHIYVKDVADEWQAKDWKSEETSDE